MLRLFNQNKNTVKAPIISDKFEYKNIAHLEHINQAIERFNQSQKALQANDQLIINSAIIGIGCWIGSYLFPTVTASIIASCYATYYWAQRPELQKQYKTALSELISIYEWSMGYFTGHHWDKLAVKEIQSLILTLGPWISLKTLKTWDADALKPTMLDGYTTGRRQDIPREFETELQQLETGNHMHRWQYYLYGDVTDITTEDIETFLQPYISKTAINNIISLVSATQPTYSRKM